MIPFFRDLLTHRRETRILRASLSRVAAERDAALADRARAEDAAVRAFRRRLCLALYGAENMAGTVDELLAHVEQIAADREALTAWRHAVCDLLCIPRTSSIEDVRAEIEPEGWPEGWSPFDADLHGAEKQIADSDWASAWVNPHLSHAQADGPNRPVIVHLTRLLDARAMAATIARRMRQEKP